MIESQRVTLRAMEPADVDLLYTWENDQRLWQYGNTRGYVSRADLQKFIDTSDLDLYQTRQLRLMIDDKQTGDTVGCVDVFDFDPFHLHASIGVMIAEEYHNRGFATHAVLAITNYCFDYWGMKSVCATTTSDNEASRKVLEVALFTLVGTRPCWIRVGNSFNDELIYCKTRE